MADDRFSKAAARQRRERTGNPKPKPAPKHTDAELSDMRPTPSRITQALDRMSAEGPQVDRDLGVEEPTVDLWETGVLVPTFEQIQRLAEYTGMLPAWFYGNPMPEITRGFICTKGSGCVPVRKEPGMVEINDSTRRGLIAVAGELEADPQKLADLAIREFIARRIPTPKNA